MKLTCDLENIKSFTLQFGDTYTYEVAITKNVMPLFCLKVVRQDAEHI